MALLVNKRGKWLTHSNSCTGFPDRHFWSHDIAEARRFGDDCHLPEHYARRTDGRVVPVPNTREELRKLARERMSFINYMKAHPTHSVWTPQYFIDRPHLYRNKEPNV